MSLTIGPLSVDPPVVLAPMAGVTDVSFRTLCRRFGAGLYVNQMVTARAFVEGHLRSTQLLTFADDESPRSTQLYSTDPAAMGDACRLLAGEGMVDHIDINFGCPVRKVTRHGGGAALPIRRRLYADIVAAAVEGAGDIPVTVKFRIGTDDDHVTFLDAGRIAEDAGCAAVALHARTAEQLYSGKARWDAIGELKTAVTSIPVLGNGDIWVASDAIAMMAATGCDGVVIGRGCLGRPWLFGELAAAFAGEPEPTPPKLGEVAVIMAEHAGLLVEWFGAERGIKRFRKHTSWYTKGFVVGPEVRRRLNQVGSLSELDDLLDGLDGDQPFPPEAAHMTRGHSGGPRPVTLPEGWLENIDDPTPPSAAAESFASGG